MAEDISNRLGDTLERLLAKRFDLIRTANSGAVRKDGDLIGKTHLIEAKATANESVSLKLHTWNKVLVEAQTHDKVPLLVYGFFDNPEAKSPKEVLVVTSLDHYLSLLKDEL